MPASASSLLQLALVVLILSPIHGTYIGQSCATNNLPGECKLLQNCTKVYQEILAGILPDELCGYSGFDPIVCCPITDRVVKSTTTSRSTTIPTIRTTSIDPNTRGSLARSKCAENAGAVYGLVVPPIPTRDVKPINISLCALTLRKLFVGSEKAEVKEFPHMAAIGFDTSNGIRWNCGGSLISKKIVLTAAHCAWTFDWGNANWVRLGGLNLVQTNDNANPQTIAVEERIRHPDYKHPTAYHDIALLRLKKEVVYDAYVRPACLPVDWPDAGKNTNAVATGWGSIDRVEENDSDNLLKVTVSLVSHQNCNASYFDGGNSVELPSGIVNEWQICAGDVGKDTCQGNSGGPLTVFNNDHYCMYTVIGVTSVGQLCDNIPGVYTRVYNYVPWIEKTAWPEYF